MGMLTATIMAMAAYCLVTVAMILLTKNGSLDKYGERLDEAFDNLGERLP